MVRSKDPSRLDLTQDTKFGALAENGVSRWPDKTDQPRSNMMIETKSHQGLQISAVRFQLNAFFEDLEFRRYTCKMIKRNFDSWFDSGFDKISAMTWVGGKRQTKAAKALGRGSLLPPIRRINKDDQQKETAHYDRVAVYKKRDAQERWRTSRQ